MVYMRTDLQTQKQAPANSKKGREIFENNKKFKARAKAVAHKKAAKTRDTQRGKCKLCTTCKSVNKSKKKSGPSPNKFYGFKDAVKTGSVFKNMGKTNISRPSARAFYNLGIAKVGDIEYYGGKRMRLALRSNGSPFWASA